MRTLLRVCSATVLLALFFSRSVGWSVGVGLSSLLTAAVLVAADDGMRATTRMEGVAILTWLYWGLSYVSNLVEALYFQVIPVLDAKRSVVAGLAIALLVACIVVWSRPGRSREVDGRVRNAAHLWWRIPFLGLLFFVFYMAAGMAIRPWIISFYQNRPLPSLGQLATLQFCRGLLDTACIFPLLRKWGCSRQRAAWVSASIFVVLCGWGPLLLPNRFLPDGIRFAHGVEMGAAGIAFGIVTVWLLLKPVAAAPEKPAIDRSHFVA
jgi:hypothetical protein